VAKSKAEKAAEKALLAAREAVDEAERAVRKLDKKTRKEAEALAGRLQTAEKDERKAVQRSRRAPAAGGAGSAASRPPAQQHSTGIPTFRDLRDRAKARGIQGYSRMNKAQLLHALGEG
jgi:hypothetical protein